MQNIEYNLNPVTTQTIVNGVTVKKQGAVVTVFINKTDTTYQSGAWRTVCTLPVGYRPPYYMYWYYASSSSNTARYRINPNGAIEVNATYNVNTIQFTLTYIVN